MGSAVVPTSTKSVDRSVWKRPLRLREAIDCYVFILPWLVGLLVFTIGPFFAGLYFSLTNYDGISAPRWIGLENYRTLLTEDPKFKITLYNTAYYVALSVLPGVALALALALLLNQKVKGITLFRTLFYIPSIVPAVASISLFIWLLHDRFGLVNEFLHSLFGIIGPNWLTSPTWTKPSLVLWGFWGLGGGMIIYLAALQGVPEALYEAAAIDGAGKIRRFWSITIPMISPTLFFVLVMSIINSFQVFTPVYILGAEQASAAAGPMDSLLFWVVYIYNTGFFYFRMGRASALAWMLFVVLVVLTVIQFRLARNWVYYESEVPA
ncbi:MAG: carbohydrate ABC transporter permease [Anaerolineae bacterium]